MEIGRNQVHVLSNNTQIPPITELEKMMCDQLEVIKIMSGVQLEVLKVKRLFSTL